MQNRGTIWINRKFHVIKLPLQSSPLAACGLAILLLAISMQSTFAQTTRSTTLPSPTADFQLHEWAIFVAEPSASRANATTTIKSTLPSFVASRRTDADAEERMNVMPIGIIRITGGAVPSPKFDVLLNLKGGEFQGEWPKAEARGPRLLWSNLVADDAKPMFSQLDEKHWLTQLREGESRYLTAGRDTHGERFLLYDAEPAFAVPLKVEAAGDGAYNISNTGSADLLNLELYKSKPDGWHHAYLNSLPASGDAKAHPATQPAESTPKLHAGDGVEVDLPNISGSSGTMVRHDKLRPTGEITLPLIGAISLLDKSTDEAEQAIKQKFGERNVPIGNVTVKIESQGSTAATAPPATGPSGPAMKLALASDAASDPKQLLAAWKDRLAATGLPPTDTNLIQSILAKYALDPGQLTAVYMLDQKQMDDLIPEEVVPTPAKTIRVGLVIVRNIDPSINEEITALIAQLGDDEWSKREEAQKKLATFGHAARSAIEKASHSKDMEVVWRSEAILHEIDPQKFPAQQ
jgi:Polysaccharide biosynthesis/export protein